MSPCLIKYKVFHQGIQNLSGKSETYIHIVYAARDAVTITQNVDILSLHTKVQQAKAYELVYLE